MTHVTADSATDTAASPTSSSSETSFTDLGREMWSYLTGKGAAIDYTFVDMTVEVPRETGPSSPRAVWKIDGTLRITTGDRDSGAAGPTSGA